MSVVDKQRSEPGSCDAQNAEANDRSVSCLPLKNRTCLLVRLQQREDPLWRIDPHTDYRVVNLRFDERYNYLRGPVIGDGLRLPPGSALDPLLLLIADVPLAQPRRTDVDRLRTPLTHLHVLERPVVPCAA